MARNFPKLNTSGEFPGVSNIDVYAYDNAFDYSRYDAAQMELTVCTVPWDMGEAHVGQRTITGIGNVVHFGSKANRDAYFTAIPDNECFRWTTKYKELHRDKAIDVPLPFDVATRFNYLKVHYDLFANDDSPIMYESATGLLDWFWFVREVEFIAPNTTRLHLLNDAWQTFIYDFEIDEMILERGHAPMHGLTANEYLANPIGNCSDLLAEDVSFGEPRIVAGTSEFVFNSGTMYAVIVTTANPVSGTWGTKAGNDWKTPGKRNFTVQGNPTYCAFAIPANALSSFLTVVENTSPQFMQTLKGIYLVAEKLIVLGSQFDFCGQTCNLVNAGYIENSLLTLNKSMFGYNAAYADIAKLYTYPYAYLTVTDENGNGYDVRIEDTDGSLQLESCVSLAYPWLNVTGHVLGIGKSGRRNVTFANLSNHSIPIQGNWTQTLMKWEIPVYGVSQDAGDRYDYDTDFDRAQATLSANNSYASASASASTAKVNADQSARATRDNSYDNADTAKTNADRSADAAKANADASADTASTNATNTANTLVSNSQLQVATNGAINTASKTSADSQYTSTMTYNTGLAAANNVLVDLSATSTIGAADQQASISAISGGITAAAGVGASIASMDIAGAVNGIVNGIVGSASTLASNSVATALTAANAGYTKAGNTVNATASNTKSDTDRNIQKTFLDAQTTAQNALTTGSAANSSATTITNAGNENATAKANALRSQSASKDNATLDKSTSRNNALRSYELARGGNSTGYDYGDGVNERTYDTAIANAAKTRDTALAAIANGVSQAALDAPVEFGEFANGDTSTTRPMGIFANVVTQDDYCISRAGDEFLRYGYAYGKRWRFDGNWNVCDRFTYWKLSDFWIKDLNIPDMYCDQLRFFLFGGVTVWRNPSDIGRVSIYDNGF